MLAAVSLFGFAASDALQLDRLALASSSHQLFLDVFEFPDGVGDQLLYFWTESSRRRAFQDVL